MKVLLDITKRNLLLNQRRSIVTMIGICLATALITSVLGMFTSFQKTLVKSCIQDRGYYHLRLKNVREEDFLTMKNHRLVSDIYSLGSVGYSKLSSSSKPYLHLFTLRNSVDFEKFSFEIIEGRKPENSQEIVISEKILDEKNDSFQLGDKVTMDIGDRMSLDGLILTPGTLYDEDKEEIKNIEQREFTIVGIIKRPSFQIEDYYDPGYSVITVGVNTQKKDIFLALAHPFSYQKDIPKLLGSSSWQDLSVDETNYDYEINHELLRWEAFKFSDKTISMLYTICFVVVSVILFTSIFCIRNAFQISTTEKTKMYGMLSSIGATKKQLYRCSLLEAFLLGIIAIPLGIFLGILAIVILVSVINLLISSFLTTEVVVFIHPFIILISILLGLFTIYFSARSSAKRASKISPIMAIRSSQDVFISRKKMKTPKFIYRFFNIGGVIAYKNLQRSKKKYRTTVISLIVSISIFIIMNSFLSYGFQTTDFYYKNYPYSIQIRNISDSDVHQVLSLEGIKKSYSIYEADALLTVSDSDKINARDDEVFYTCETGGDCIESETPVTNLNIIGLTDSEFKEYVRKLNLNYEDSLRKGILIDDSAYTMNGKTYFERRYRYQKGDVILGKIHQLPLEVEVAKVTKTRPVGLENWYSFDGMLVVNIEQYKDLHFTLDVLSIDTDVSDSVEDNALKISSQMNVYNMEKQAREQRSMILIVSIFLYGFILVITLIGITNIFNTILANMELRKRELAMLKSIGMTKKEFRRMLNLETIFYSTKALFFGIIIGLIGSYLIYYAFSKGIEFAFEIPFPAIFISTISVFLLVFWIMRFSMKKQEKQNILEMIRDENI